MRLNGVKNCGELKVRHLSLKKPQLYLDVSNILCTMSLVSLM